jgi:hypothetical protein
MNALAANLGKRAVGAIVVLILLVLVAVGGGFAAWTFLEAKWIEVEAAQTELQVMRRRVAAAARSKQSTERALSGDPFLDGTSFALAAARWCRRWRK